MCVDVDTSVLALFQKLLNVVEVVAADEDARTVAHANIHLGDFWVAVSGSIGFVTGGTTLFTEGLFAINSHIQKENGKNPPDLGYDLFTTAMDYHHWYADGALFRKYIDKSGENIAWLESVGVEFQGTGTMCANEYNTWHQYRYEEGQISGRTYVDNLTKAVTEAGATLVLGSLRMPC